MKGQVAFETIFILLVIITATVYISSLYTSTNDITIAESVARNEINEQAILQSEKIVITKITYQKSSPSIMTIDILAEYPTRVDFNTDKIADKVKETTKITEIQIVINKKQL